MASYKNTFTDLGEFNTKTLEDDFTSKTLFTNKIKAKTGGNGNLTYKHKTNFVQKTKSFSDSRELKFDFPLTSRYFLWYGIRDSGEIKLHLDCGNVTVAKQDFNIFTNVKVNKDRTKFAYRLGALYNTKYVNGGVRLESDCCDPSTVCLTERALFRKGDLFAGVVGTLGLCDLKFCRLDGVLGYNHKKFDLTVRHLAGDSCSPCSPKDTHSNLLGRLVVDAVYKHNDKHSFAFQGEENLLKNTRTFAFGHSSKVCDKLSVRNRINDGLQWGLAVKYRASNLFTFTVSTQIDFKADKPVNFDNAIPFPIGFQTEFSI